MVRKIKTLCASQKIKRAFSNEDGLSLIEAAIGLLLLGLLVMPIIQARKHEVVKEIREINYGSIQNSIKGVNQFFGSGNGAYPCPASLTLAEGDTDFGVSGDCTLANVRLCTDPLWPANEGICKTDNTVDAIIIGGIPFTTLKMPQEQSLDYWGNKLIYAVTHKQTDQVTYATNTGEIRLLAMDDPVGVLNATEDGIPDQLANLYDLFVFSTGSNGTGGYTKDGNPITPCGNAATGYEFENCNFDNIFFIDRNSDVDGADARSDVIGATYYDDWTIAQQVPPISTWFQHEDNPTYVNRDYVLTLSTRVGIGTTTPDESLEVMGAIRSENNGIEGGRIKSDSICNDTDCFDPEMITGTFTDMNCTASLTFPVPRVVTELSNGTVTCSTALDTLGNPIGGGNNLQVDTGVFSAVPCAGGQIAVGIDATGGLLCAAP